jgi:hypothetical protein
MKKPLLPIALICSLPFLAQSASFSGGDLLLVRVGDGVTTLANSAGPISILEVNSAGTLVQPAVNIPSGNGGLQISGTATSEGQLARNASGSSWTLAGYVPPFSGSGSLSSRTAANAPRGYLTISDSGALSSVTTLPGTTTYSTQNIRSGLASGSSLWFAGSGTSSGTGVTTYDGSSVTTIQGVNSRVLNLYNGDLYYSTGSGTVGIYKYTGTPTTPTTSTAFLTGVIGQGGSPYDFVFSPTGNSLYVADDAIGVQKFTFNGSAWSLAYNFTDTASANKAYGLAVDFSGANPVLYWTSPTDLWSTTDSGAGAAGVSILSAGANFAFRGLDMAPVVPEPTSFALASLGCLLLLRRFSRS